VQLILYQQQDSGTGDPFTQQDPDTADPFTQQDPGTADTFTQQDPGIGTADTFTTTGSRIESIGPGAFQSLHHLKILNLSHNRIQVQLMLILSQQQDPGTADPFTQQDSGTGTGTADPFKTTGFRYS
jgi:hypothetical protein